MHKYRFLLFLILTIFVLTNSGFTAIIRQCTMTSPKDMTCCDSSGDQNQTTANEGRTQSESTLSLTQTDCHISILVGGLTFAPALLEKNNPVLTSKAIACIVSHEEQGPLCTFDVTSALVPNSAATIAPPPVEKCVLNSSFLI